jgi:hypothetical protein
MITSTLQRLIEDILENAGDCTRERKKKRISIKDLFKAWSEDSDLKDIMKGCILPGTPVEPTIRPVRRKRKPKPAEVPTTEAVVEAPKS